VCSVREPLMDVTVARRSRVGTRGGDCDRSIML
jgi:hypothetical protein